MVRVAVDPNKPDTAWAAAVDDPGKSQDTLDAIERWLNQGARIKRVPISRAKAMLARWAQS